MQKNLQLKLLPREAASTDIIHSYCASALGLQGHAITGFHILKQSLDARGKQPRILISLLVFIDEPFTKRIITRVLLKDVSRAARKVAIVGAGPAGLFAALTLASYGIRPIILERGKDVRARRRDLALLNKEGIVNPESNYCFGEGGAGTYSDGKLYTRSTKRGDVNRILNILVQFGADENILYEAHPHIGTNKLPQIITSIRQALIACGAEFYFEKKLGDLVVEKGRISKLICTDRHEIAADAVILATGHSARDIFLLLHRKNILIEAKPFALGVRIEHPQELIDQIQYGNGSAKEGRSVFLPPASYSLVEQVHGKGVFSFCMCPGGIIAPASTAPGELVVNGWSPSKRNNPYSNSGIVVSVDPENFTHLQNHGPLAAMYFQQAVEVIAYQAGGGDMVAPAQRMTDYVENKISSSFPDCSYLPGINPASLKEVLPGFVHENIRQAFTAFGKKMKGYYTREAVVVATESRTSSPVRIPRHPESLKHPQIINLYPCGEGAGYAGGIVSAAMDGERVANRLAGELSTIGSE